MAMKNYQMLAIRNRPPRVQLQSYRNPGAQREVAIMRSWLYRLEVTTQSRKDLRSEYPGWFCYPRPGD